MSPIQLCLLISLLPNPQMGPPPEGLIHVDDVALWLQQHGQQYTQAEPATLPPAWLEQPAPPPKRPSTSYWYGPRFPPMGGRSIDGTPVKRKAVPTPPPDIGVHWRRDTDGVWWPHKPTPSRTPGMAWQKFLDSPSPMGRSWREYLRFRPAQRRWLQSILDGLH